MVTECSKCGSAMVVESTLTPSNRPGREARVEVHPKCENPDCPDRIDAAGRGVTETVLDRSADATDPGSLGGDSGGA